jgi:hypothetical protein
LQRAIGNQAVQRVRQHLGHGFSHNGRITLQADVDAGAPPAKAPATPPAKAPATPREKAPEKAPAAPACTFTITYANQKSLGCGPKEPRGASIRYDITKVTASGKGCPATLDGLKLTEKVTSDQGCHPQQPTPGEGCTIRADKKKPLEGRLEKCTDTYSVCGDKQAFLFKGCTQVLTQEIFVDGVLADTRKIEFEIFRTGEKPSGKVTRK